MPKGIPNKPKQDNEETTMEHHPTPKHSHDWIYINKSVSMQPGHVKEDGKVEPPYEETRLHFVCNCGAMRNVVGFEEQV